MRVIELQASNFKRLKAVTIRPTTNLVEVSGDNGEGKCSTLDAIWAALGGKDACPDKPIHTGEERAEVSVVLGDDDGAKFKVTRRFRLKEGVPYTTDLVLETHEGARFDKPQDILNQMVGRLCFDPMAFLTMPDKDQITALRRFVPEVEFDTIEGLNRRDFEKRTEVGRTVRDLKGQLAALPALQGDVPEAVDVAALESKLGEAAAHNSQVEQRRVRRENAQTRVESLNDEIKRLTAERDTLQAELDAAPKLPALIDVVDVQQRLAEGRRANEHRAKAAERQAVAGKLEAAQKEEADLTADIDARKLGMSKAVQAAKMPIPGLGFGEDPKGDGFVTLNGEPLAQASRAEQIRASVAIAAAMNPKLRVARVMDGSLLDRKSWAALEAYATEHDLQVWVETVQQHGKGAVVIEDGGVVAPQEEVGDVL